MVEMQHADRRTQIALLAAILLLTAACGSSDATTAAGDSPAKTSTVVTTTTQATTTTTTTSGVPSTTPPATTTIDQFRVETDRIIQAWIDGWLADDPAQVLVLYGEDSVYADKGCPFEMIGKAAIRTMVTGHMGATTYTVADPVEITYTRTGAVVQWIWGGTHRAKQFTMEASTTFEIANGLILRSTDSYNRSDAPAAWEADCIAYNGGS